MSEDKPKQIIDDRSRTFAERYGYVPLPDTADYKLCREFRSDFGEIINMTFLDPLTALHTGEYQERERSLWFSVSADFQKHVLKRSFNKVSNNPISSRILMIDTVLDGEFWQVLSIIELVLKLSSKTNNIQKAIRKLFTKQLVPYAIDDSTQPVCIIPLDVPEAGEAIVGAMENIHCSGVTSAHQHLRGAAEHINAEQYGDAIADSVHAVEAIAREMTGKETLGLALNALQKEELLRHDALKQGVNKLYGYASDTIRHGQPTTKAQSVKQTRDEALLIFSSCAAIAGYLARKKMQMEGTK